MRVFFLLVSLLLVCEVVLSASPSCRDESGNPVDWWVILKAPVDPESGQEQAQDGYGYSYTDPTKRLSFTTRRLDTDLTNSLGSTLAQVYKRNSTNAYFMYNDQSPDDVSHNSYGHLKGVLGFDKTAGFWLVHSVPRYPLGPASTSSYQGYPDYAKTYGQSFLCISMNFTQINLVAGGLLIDKPYVYDKKTPFVIPTTAGNITKLINKQFVTLTPATSTIKILSKGSVPFTVFAKNQKWDKDLYSDLVQPKFNRNMLFETWMNGANTNEMPSFCKPTYPLNSINVREVTLASDVIFSETKDHSKWGITETQTTSTISGSLVCIGDINRQFSQSDRGGGTVCFNNKNLYLDFKSIISTADIC